MIASRKIEDLHPEVAKRAIAFKADCASEGIDIIFISTRRDNESQNALFAQGRTTPGKIVTNAKGGQSFHNYGVAFDVVPLRDRKAVWGIKGVDLELWQRVGVIGKKHGLEWAGDWKTFKEFPHFQYTGGLTLKDFQAGKTLPV